MKIREDWRIGNSQLSIIRIEHRLTPNYSEKYYHFVHISVLGIFGDLGPTQNVLLPTMPRRLYIDASSTSNSRETENIGQFTWLRALHMPSCSPKTLLMAIMHTKLLENENKVTSSVYCWSFTNETMPQSLKKCVSQCQRSLLSSSSF